MRNTLLTLALTGALALAQKPVLTTNGGVPVGDNQNSKTAGENGPVLLEDIHLIEKLASFDRERIPERVVHARGAGAHGEFEAAGNFSSVARASFLNAPGRKTPVFVRFSTVIHQSGSPEIARDPRGFATKFYTDEGNYDIVGNNLPVFFIRDAIKFPDMVHSLKPSPVTNKQDPSRFFDFFEGHALAARPLLAVPQLLSERMLLLREGHCLRDDVLTVCSRAKVQFQQVFESDHLTSIFSLVANGFGISIVPALAAAEARGCALIPLEPRGVRKIGYAQVRGHHSLPLQKRFISFLRGHTWSV